MAELGEKDNENDGITVVDPKSCDWMECQTNHAVEINYPNNGDVERNSTYEEDWVTAGLEPWELHGPGIDSRATEVEYRSENKRAEIVANAVAMNHPYYPTQKHHLISVNLFTNWPDLTHNAKLIGYDANHVNNGVCLPSFTMDIVQHRLQCHRGPHKKILYNDNIDPLLEEIEEDCLTYCSYDYDGEMSWQEFLIFDLNQLSSKIEHKILAWEWLLRTRAHDDRRRSYARLEVLQARG